MPSAGNHNNAISSAVYSNTTVISNHVKTRKATFDFGFIQFEMLPAKQSLGLLSEVLMKNRVKGLNMLHEGGDILTHLKPTKINVCYVLGHSRDGGCRSYAYIYLL